jgi:hypothetical protein
MKRFLDPDAAGGVTTAPATAPVTQATDAPPDPVAAVLQRIDAAIAPLTQRLSAIEQQVQQAAVTPAPTAPAQTPVTQAVGAPSPLYAAGGPAGSAPGIRQGEDTMGSRGFLMQRGIVARSG